MSSLPSKATDSKQSNEAQQKAVTSRQDGARSALDASAATFTPRTTPGVTSPAPPRSSQGSADPSHGSRGGGRGARQGGRGPGRGGQYPSPAGAGRGGSGSGGRRRQSGRGSAAAAAAIAATAALHHKAAPPTSSSSGSAGGAGARGSDGPPVSSSAGRGGGYSSSGSGGPGGGPAPAGAGSSKGPVNANYLLNFQYDSRTVRGGARGGRPPAAGGGGRRRPPPPRLHRYDKDKFLQANFRFLVSDAVDFTAFDEDADRMFEWEDVVQVEMMTSSAVQCPISLEAPPSCAQITPCGHIFSYAAIMRHLQHHGGEQLRAAAPCPLCYQPLVARELRLVQVRQVAVPAVGDTLTFQLLRRPRHSIIPTAVKAPRSRAAAAAAGAASEAMSPPSLSVVGPAAGGGASSGGMGLDTAPQQQLQAGSPPWDTSSTTSSGSLSRAHSGLPHSHRSRHKRHHHHHHAHGQQHVSDPLAANVFRKYAVVEDAMELWLHTVQQLGAQMAQIMSEGGLEAELEAPGLFGAMDSLADRARRFAQRRAEVLDQQGMWTGDLSPFEAGKAADAAVRAAFDKAVAGAKGGGAAAGGAAGGSGGSGVAGQAPQAAAVEEFPALGAAAGAGSGSGSSSSRGGGGGGVGPTAGGSPPGPAGRPPPGAAVGSPVWPVAASRAPSGPVGSSSSTPPGTSSATPPPPAVAAAAGGGAPGSSQSLADSAGTPAAAAAEAEAGTGPAAGAAGAGKSGGAGEELEEPQSPSAELMFEQAFSEDEEPPGDSALQPAQEGAEQPPAASGSAAAAVDQEQQQEGTKAEAAAANVGGGSEGSGKALAATSAAAQDSLLGSSPNTASAVNLTQLTTEGDFYYFYQAADGQWLYLHPVNLRCLLTHYGSYRSCPPTITARAIEMEDATQTDITRKRWKFLAHLPLYGGFRLVECVLPPEVLPAEALAPFAEELAARDKRRKRRESAAKREAAREAAEAAAAEAAKRGPSVSELRAMPRLGEDSDGSAAAGGREREGTGGGDLLSPTAMEEALLAQAMFDSGTAAAGGVSILGSSPSAGVSFARMTKMGFAATGPDLKTAAAGGGGSSSSSATAAAAAGGGPAGPNSSSPGPAGPGAAEGTPPPLRGVWGAAAASSQSAASKLAGPKPPAAPGSSSGAAWGGAAGGSSSGGAGRALPTGGVSAALAAAKSSTGAAAATAGGATGSSDSSSSQWLVLAKDGAPAAGSSSSGGGGTAAPAVGGEAQGPGEGNLGAAAAGGGKGKGKKGVMVFSTAQRRY